MIPLRRPPLDGELRDRLSRRAAALRERAAGAAEARQEWRRARAVRSSLLELLENAAPGIIRCMYCGDSEGTAIDHFEPLVRAPLRAFDWLNHLLACSHCNSNEKRDRYPCGPDGSCLLVDPCREDPADHLRLILPTGEYRPHTEKGAETIRTFGLDREVLKRGRAHAYVRCKSMLRDYDGLCRSGEKSEAGDVARALGVHPFADVLYSMVRVMHEPGAPLVMGAQVVAALHSLVGGAAFPYRVTIPAARPGGVTTAGRAAAPPAGFAEAEGDAG
ncbi:HNH endonuclease [Streptomyces sp. WAC 00631]|uniref:HNH endonuclease n=1 Tax=Streptomyces sp. WAC 00631 TaxID=2203201 RepID=UPI00163CC207|nr:HNH endonuclease [Streptomyces sp. WAC 00631]MCC5035280.1 HNH endonuclease [Streptomyces sp. WAC 00631]